MELNDIPSVLANVPFLDICDDEQRRLLAFASEERRFSAGEIVFAQGDAGDGAFVLVRGSVAITDDGLPSGKSFGVSGPNVLLGELALVLDRPRRKTVTAVTNLQTIYIPRSAFLKLMRQFPDMAERAKARIEEELTGFLGSLKRFGGHASDE